MSDTITVTGEVTQQVTTVATQGPQGIQGRTDGYVLIQSASDLTPYVDGTDSYYTLPADTQIVLAGSINIGSRYIILSEGTMLRGFANATLTSSATGGVIRCSGIAAAVVMREFNIVATAGPCLNLSGPITQQLNLFFLGLFGATAGTITGFDVQALKDCFINTADGLTLAGTTNKVFISQCPFYGITAGNAAITLDSTLDAEAVDMQSPFFKADAGTAIVAEAGYSVTSGVLHDGIIQGTMTPFSGFTSADVNWDVRNVSGVSNSRIVAESHATASYVVPIAAINTPTAVVPTSSVGGNNERFTNDGNSRLTYTGRSPATILATCVMQVQPAANNVNFRVFMAKNGVPITTPGIPGFVGTGNDIRTATITDVISIVTGDVLSVFIQNETDTTDITVSDLRINAMG